jgi:putative ABC transport system substrate-binding protein
MITRRRILLALGATTLCVAVPALAQQAAKLRRIGFLNPNPQPKSFDSGISGAFLKGMRDLGYIEGKHFVMEWRFYGQDSARLREFVTQLVNSNIDIILATGPGPGRLLREVTLTIPIVLSPIVDPVGSGLVQSLARPGGNITGLTSNQTEAAPKYVELLKSFNPKLERIAVLVNPTNESTPPVVRQVREAAASVGIRIVVLEASLKAGLDQAFAFAVRERAQALVITPDPFFQGNLSRISKFCVQQRIPSISSYLDYPDAGGLMSYGQNTTDFYYRAAVYVDKIFKGTHPRDLPFEQPSRYYLHINRSTAKALGLAISQELLLRADKIIE